MTPPTKCYRSPAGQGLRGVDSGEPAPYRVREASGFGSDGNLTTQGDNMRWILIALQPIPLVGALVIPLMCLSSYWIYKRALVGRVRKELAVA